MAMPQPGGEFAGYDVLSLLGRGGMGSVFLVHNPHLDRREALKALSVNSSGDFAARFAAEARTVAKLDHPGIVTVYHHGITDDMPWFTMQYLEGSDLDGAGTLPYGDVVAIVSQTAAALDYAHRRGVVHRDVKPANILVRRDAHGAIDRVTVLDFGIARLAGATSMTAAGSFVGTLSYAAPESVDGRRDIPAADQYSLAATAYALLAGRPPFAGLPTAALLHAQLSETPPPISRFVPELAGLDPVFATALAKDPAQRYSSCQAFAAALASGGDPKTRKQTLVAPVSTPAPYTQSGTGYPPTGTAYRPAAGPYPPAPAKTSRTTIVLALIAILIGIAVIAGAIVLATRGDDSSRTSSAAGSSTASTADPAGSTPADAPSTTTASDRVWGFVVSPEGRVIRFRNYASREAMLGKAAEYGYNSTWGYASFTSGCGAVARAAAAGSSDSYFVARGSDRASAESQALSEARRSTGAAGTTVSSLCVGDSLS
ncbi:serine/threonine protein kinase [Gordonia iterans]|uniref:non-specific serine/threonine protein kinase n=1 Tax=Gordonia iterans TaxID=1004901 RepID=A0A2S0KFH0_9ACTN|nr:serine/threonine-protein kinase [Gordonia iterans]AVM00414.1 serine/threonine protein kinase [Gordonia iterans]